MAKKWNFREKLKKFKFKNKLKSFKSKKKKDIPEDVPFFVPDTPPKKQSKRSSKFPGFLGLPARAFDIENRGKFHKFFLATLILSACWFTGRISALFLIPTDMKTSPGNIPTVAVQTEAPEQWQSYTLLLKNKDLFKTVKAGQPKKRKKSDEAIVCDDADTKSSLPLKLMNTVVLQDSIKSLASVQVRSDRELKNIREGEKIDNLAEIFHIERLRIVLKNLNTSECEFVSHQKLEEENKIKSPQILSNNQFNKIKDSLVEDGIKQVGNTICISRSLINEKLADFNKILTEARAIQLNNPDGTMSFKIVEINPGSIYSHLNIKDNDIIKTINGQPISGMQAIMGLFGKISKLPKLNLELERDGNLIPMQYEFSQTSPATCKE